MNDYATWLKKHLQKRDTIVSRKKELSNESLLEYFDYESLSKSEKSFCPLFEKGVKCHKLESLNCFFCACPYFRFYDTPVETEGKKVHSYCSINSRFAKVFSDGIDEHLDCSDCFVPHRRGFARRNLRK